MMRVAVARPPSSHPLTAAPLPNAPPSSLPSPLPPPPPPQHRVRESLLLLLLPLLLPPPPPFPQDAFAISPSTTCPPVSHTVHRAGSLLLPSYTAPHRVTEHQGKSQHQLCLAVSASYQCSPAETISFTWNSGNPRFMPEVPWSSVAP